MCKASPNLRRNKRGSFTRPISSCCGTWVQASAISTWASGRKAHNASAPCRNCRMSPFWRANKTEKEVSRVCGGQRGSTVGNTCESVIIRDGGDDKTDNVADKRSAVQHKAVQRLSNRLRKVCTCGRINRPLGAWMSCGMTNTTVSHSPAKFPVKSSTSSVRRYTSAIADSKRSRPSPVRAETDTTSVAPNATRQAPTWLPPSSSTLLYIYRTGMSSTRKRSAQAFSFSAPSGKPDTTIKAKSTLRAALTVCFTRSPPNSPSSS